MRYAIISDVHANEAALRAVLTDAADAQAEKVICLGDVLGYGPDPVSTLELVYRRVHVCLAGNHDDAVTGRFPVTDFTPFAAQAVARHRAALSRRAITWLRSLSHVCEFPAIYEGADGAFACAHGDFANPEQFNYVLEPEDALPSWQARTEQLLFVGHSHKPGIFVLGPSGQPHALDPADFVLEPNKRYLVNVGSVGYPRSGACRSFYCIYDNLSRSVFFRSLPFDLEAYRLRMNGQGLDEAPWMKAREQSRGGCDVRDAAHFSKETAAVKRILVKPPAAAKPETPSAPSAPRAPKPLVPAAPRRQTPSWLVPAFVVGGLVVLGLIVCCVKLATNDSPRQTTRSVPAPVSSTMSEDGSKFSDMTRLSGDWCAAFEYPQDQNAVVAPHRGRDVEAYRLSSAKYGTIRLTKRFELAGSPPKVYWTVALQSSSAPGKALNFGFNVRVAFYAANGSKLNESTGEGKRSRKNKPVPVPPGSAYAIMTIDCFCEGTYDLEVPYFRTEPDERKSL